MPQDVDAQKANEAFCEARCLLRIISEHFDAGDFVLMRGGYLVCEVSKRGFGADIS